MAIRCTGCGAQHVSLPAAIAVPTVPTCPDCQPKTELTPAGEQFVIPGCERNASPRTVQLALF